MLGRIIMQIRSYIGNLSIHTKLTLSNWIAAVIPLFMVFAIISLVLFNVTVDNAKTQAQLTLDKTIDELNLWILQVNEGVSSLSTDINIQNAICHYATEDYKDKLDTRDFIRNRLVNIYTSDMRAVNVSLYLSDVRKTFSKDFMDLELYNKYYNTDWFCSLLYGKTTYYCGKGNSLENGKPVIIMASAIISVQNGRIIGISYVELAQEKVYDNFKTLTGNSGNAVLLGDELIASPNYVPGGSYASVYSRVEPFQLDVEYRLQLQELQKGFYVAFAYFVMGLIVIMVLIYVIDKMFSDWFARRIITLRNATKEIAAGNLETVVSDRHNDEIGELSTSLNTMARDMKRLIEENYLVKIENQHATLQALQSQINPHFVYNTLESISMLALIHDNYEIVEITQAFSSMMRYSIGQSPQVDVQAELENVKHYVAIQKIRFPGKFDVSYHVQSGCERQRLLRFSLQPLVENAFVHGFEDMPQHGNLVISVRASTHSLRIRVFNDGVVIAKSRIARIRELVQPNNTEPSMECFALRNLSRRLRLTYGSESRLWVRSRAGVGTIITIKAPLAKAEDAEKNAEEADDHEEGSYM